MKVIQTRLLLVVTSYILSYFLAWYFGYIYMVFSSSSLGGTFITPSVGQWLVGAPLALIVLITFLLNVIGGKNKWWWIIISLIPAILFEVFLDPFHVYIPALTGLIAWGLGTMAHKVLQKLAPSFMSKISQDYSPIDE